MFTFISNIYVNIYNSCDYLQYLFFNLVGPVKIIYHNGRNITFNYLFGIKVPTAGLFYLKQYQHRKMIHCAFYGNNLSLNMFDLFVNPINKSRKSFIMLNNGTPLDLDLNILDNYHNIVIMYSNSIYKKRITNVRDICKILNIDCTHIQITQIMPFKRETLDIDNMDITYLYK